MIFRAQIRKAVPRRAQWGLEPLRPCYFGVPSVVVHYLLSICPLLVQSLTEHILDIYCIYTEQECPQIAADSMGIARLGDEDSF